MASCNYCFLTSCEVCRNFCFATRLIAPDDKYVLRFKYRVHCNNVICHCETCKQITYKVAGKTICAYFLYPLPNGLWVKSDFDDGDNVINTHKLGYYPILDRCSAPTPISERDCKARDIPADNRNVIVLHSAKLVMPAKNKAFM